MTRPINAERHVRTIYGSWVCCVTRVQCVDELINTIWQSVGTDLYWKDTPRAHLDRGKGPENVYRGHKQTYSEIENSHQIRQLEMKLYTRTILSPKLSNVAKQRVDRWQITTKRRFRTIPIADLARSFRNSVWSGLQLTTDWTTNQLA